MIKTLAGAWDYLKSLIIDSQPFATNPEIPFRRAMRLLELLGNPQNRLKVIHVAGTSGKGSTAYYISQLLNGHGFSVGLHVSPHLTDIRERFQMNNSLVSNRTFVAYLNKVKQASDLMAGTDYGQPSYFEALVAMSYLLFYEKKVDYAVIETGMGGWYDATNSVKRSDKLCVITPIGLDHTSVLGDTLEKIALQKAKIIQPGNAVVAHKGPLSVRRVFEKVARERNTAIAYLTPAAYRNARIENNSVTFDFNAGGIAYNHLLISTLALYQAENAALAILALSAVASRDGFIVREKKVRLALKKPAFAGRMDLVQKSGRKVLFDGAHNPQKMKAFLESLKASYPGRKFRFLLAFKKGKAYREMIKLIGPLVSDVTVTRFVINVQDSNHLSEDPVEVAAVFASEFPHAALQVVPDPAKAYNIALSQVPPGGLLVVTGSLYLISCLYRK